MIRASIGVCGWAAHQPRISHERLAKCFDKRSDFGVDLNKSLLLWIPSGSSAVTVTESEFMLLTKIPIVIYDGDNIPEKPSVNPGQEQWRIALEIARRWRDVVNRRGGDITLVHLPEIGIRGNTHFLMSDTNNLQIADQVSNFLSKKKLG